MSAGFCILSQILKRQALPVDYYFLTQKKHLIAWNGDICVLKKIKFGPNFIKIVQVLYSNPSVRVVTAGHLSDLFNIFCGSIQGCPASPSIFNLSLEPLAQYIRQSVLVAPIKVGSTSHSISMYADDTLVYLSDLQQSLPNVLKIIDHFGTISGYKINHSKSILMLLNTDLKKCNIQYIILVAQKAVYLGIEISPCIQAMARNNYSSILKKVADDLVRWAALPSSMPARVATIKMNVLPCVNFISFMLPLPTPAGYWQKLDSTLKKLIWNGKKSRDKPGVDGLAQILSCIIGRLYCVLKILVQCRISFTLENARTGIGSSFKTSGCGFLWTQTQEVLFTIWTNSIVHNTDYNESRKICGF